MHIEHNFDNCNNYTCKRKSQNMGYKWAIDDIKENVEKAIFDVILSHQEQLDFVSGLAMANHIVDEVIEKLRSKLN